MPHHLTATESSPRIHNMLINIYFTSCARGLRGGLSYPICFARKGPILPYEMFHTDRQTHICIIIIQIIFHTNTKPFIGYFHLDNPYTEMILQGNHRDPPDTAVFPVPGQQPLGSLFQKKKRFCVDQGVRHIHTYNIRPSKRNGFVFVTAIDNHYNYFLLRTKQDGGVKLADIRVDHVKVNNNEQLSVRKRVTRP